MKALINLSLKTTCFKSMDLLLRISRHIHSIMHSFIREANHPSRYIHPVMHRSPIYFPYSIHPFTHSLHSMHPFIRSCSGNSSVNWLFNAPMHHRLVLNQMFQCNEKSSEWLSKTTTISTITFIIVFVAIIANTAEIVALKSRWSFPGTNRKFNPLKIKTKTRRWKQPGKGQLAKHPLPSSNE